MTKKRSKAKSKKARDAHDREAQALFEKWDAFAMKYPSSGPCLKLAELVIRHQFCECCGGPEVEMLLAHQIQNAVTRFLNIGARFRDDGSLIVEDHLEDDDDTENDYPPELLCEYPCVHCGIPDFNSEHASHCPYWWVGENILTKAGVRGGIDAYDKVAKVFLIAWDGGGVATWTLEALQRDAVLERAPKLLPAPRVQ